MTRTSLGLTDPLNDYLRQVGSREPAALATLRAETAPMAGARMQISSEQGALMALMVRMLGARRVLEIGTYTGYSALAMALALPAEGRITTLDRSEEWTAVARRHWHLAGVEARVELRLGEAVPTLDTLIDEGREGFYDLAFIDAAKTEYPQYLERCHRLLRPHGVVMIDNVLWGGKVIDDADTSADTTAIRAFNQALHQDQRFDLAMVPIGDGLTLARKRT